jgi:hypothetical protein
LITKLVGDARAILTAVDDIALDDEQQRAFEGVSRSRWLAVMP